MSKSPYTKCVLLYVERNSTDLEGKGMGQNASGMYIVDDNYNIVGFNTVAEHMYPRIKKEEKCYEVPNESRGAMCDVSDL